MQPAIASKLTPPKAGEFAPFYAGYIARVADEDVTEVLRRQPEELRELLGTLDDEQAATRYAPGKWSIREVAGHLSDTERVMAYRALRFSRGDTTPLPGFDENAFVQAAAFDRQPLAKLLDDFGAARSASLSMFEGMEPDAFARRGAANGVEMSVRAIIYVLAGHPRHHMALLEERYLPLIS